MTEHKTVTSLPPEVTKRFLPFLEKMRALHGENLLSVWIFGSATGVNFSPQTSDINSGLLFNHVDGEILRRSAPLIAAASKQRIATPLFLTRQYIESSLDVFPIEFWDMKENNVLIYGEDILASLDIKGRHVRLFCEQQLKGKLFRTQQAYLEVNNKEERVLTLAQESLKSLWPTFRNLLRLKGRTPPVKKEVILQAMTEIFGMDAPTFLKIYHAGAQDNSIAAGEIHPLFEQYLKELSKLSRMVDQL